MQSNLVIHNGTLVLLDKLVPDGVVVCKGERIVSVAAKGRALPAGEQIDARGGFIAPGFVDLHVHGGAGADFMDGTPEAVRTALHANARHGTTTIFPTTTTGSPEQIRNMLDACKSVQQRWTPADGARIAGVHFYGPYFAPNKTGCHSKEGRRDPQVSEYTHALKSGIVRIATCAAELPGADAFYRAARRADCLCTCGHSDASWTEMDAAFRAGMRHVDHFWCAMSSVSSLRARFGSPMQASMEQFVLMNAEMSTEIIADGCHLSAELLEFAYRMKGARRLCLVTDASRALDMPPGDYRFGSREDGPMFRSDGKVGLKIDGGLASSVRGMDTMVQVMKQQTSASLPEVIRMASLTPAERAGIDAETGSLSKGKRADVLVLSKRLAVQRVIIGGSIF